MREGLPSTPFGMPPVRASHAPSRFAAFAASSDFAHNPTIDHLRLVLGEDKANALVSNIGEAALRAAPAGSNVSLGAVVAATLARLTDTDLASIARGDTTAMSRAQSFAEEQVKTAQNQNTQMAANIHGAGAAGHDGAGGGRWINGQWVPGASRGDSGLAGNNSGRFAGMKEAGVSSGVSPTLIADYTRQYRGMGFGKDMISTFAAVHLDSQDFRELEQRGLKRHEIAAAARDTKGMGLLGKDDVEHAHYMARPVKDHLKRANSAHKRGDSAAENREVEGAERDNQRVTDPNRRKHGEEGIRSYRKIHGLMENNTPTGAPNPATEAGRKAAFQKSEQGRKKAGAQPDF
jgi:hypothetical protein